MKESVKWKRGLTVLFCILLVAFILIVTSDFSLLGKVFSGAGLLTALIGCLLKYDQIKTFENDVE